MPRFSEIPGSMDFLRYDVTNLAYYARHSGRAAVIGVGSGRDLLSAHLFGFRDITGVELNPVFVDLLTDPTKLRVYAGVADLPGVRFVVDDGRSWFARTQEKFDLIEMSMVDTFAATGAGAFSLSEKGLYGRRLEDVSLRTASERAVHGIPVALAHCSGGDRTRSQPSRRCPIGTPRRQSPRAHLRRHRRESRHRRRVPPAIRRGRPAGAQRGDGKVAV